MPKFRKRPVEVEAIQFKTEESYWDIKDFCDKHDCYVYRSINGDRISIPTLEGSMTASLGDWVIRGVMGEFYSCKPNIFEATYDPVEE